MAESGKSDDRTLPHPSMGEVQAACFEFEQAWRANEIQQVEDYLAKIPFEGRGALFQRLLACEMNLRRESGQTLDVREYHQRFPRHADDVEAAQQISQQWAVTSTVDDGLESGVELMRVVDRYLVDLQNGKAPNKKDLLAANPSIASQLEAYLAGIDFLHQPEQIEALPSSFGRYLVQGMLGKGAFGLVCLARDLDLNRLVALKVPPDGRFSSPAEVERFISEARTAAQLEHPGIVTVYDVIREDDRVVIVQQYVPGMDLRRTLERSGSLPFWQAVEITIAIAEALTSAHEKGIVHRDLKPSNILLDEKGQPHVADFGLALHKSFRHPSRGDCAGTPEYMSPEQVRGEADQLDGRSDLWSLGVVLYEMLTGCRPFGAASSPALFSHIEHTDPAPPRQIRSDIPDEIERICMKCLSKPAAKRYARVSDLADDLRHFVTRYAKVPDRPFATLLPFGDASREQSQDYYQRGRKFYYQYRLKGIDLAIDMFRLAIKHDSNYALAYAGIADCHCFRVLHSKFDQRIVDQADEASRHALKLAPDSAEAHTSRGNVLSVCGRHDEAQAEFEAAVRLGPNLFDTFYLYARDCFAQGDLTKAISLYQRAYEINPRDYQAPLLVAQSYARLGRPAEADAARRLGVEIAQARLATSPDDVRALYMGANALVLLGDIEKSLEWANLALSMEPDEPLVLYNVACICSLAGQLDEAIEYLERSIHAGLRHKGWLDHDDNLDPLRNTPRFQTLLEHLE
jgi:tetratricopeptide (TPR) repeat protein